MKKRTGVVILTIGALCLIGAAVAVAVGVTGFIDKLKPVVVVEAPGGGAFDVEEPGTYTLWHDHTTIRAGTRHHHPRELPPGFTFTLTHAGSGQAVPFTPFRSSTTQTMNTTERESVGLGTFRVTDPGTFRLDAANPAGDRRFLSLTEGSIVSSIGSFGASFGIAALLGLLGVGGLVAGFIGVLAGRKSPPTVPLPPSTP